MSLKHYQYRLRDGKSQDHQNHGDFERYLAEYERRFEREYGFFRPIVKEVVERYFDCGNPRRGFGRIRCPDCAGESLFLPSLSGSRPGGFFSDLNREGKNILYRRQRTGGIGREGAGRIERFVEVKGYFSVGAGVLLFLLQL